LLLKRRAGKTQDNLPIRRTVFVRGSILRLAGLEKYLTFAVLLGQLSKARLRVKKNKCMPAEFGEKGRGF
jgi:hypothetical protein